MRTALTIFIVHLSVGTTLLLFAMFHPGLASWYAGFLFDLWNLPGVWTLRVMGLSPTLATLGMGIDGLVTLVTTELLLALAVLAIVRVGKPHGA